MANDDFVITGAEQFGELARRLKEAGDKDLKKELYSGINRAVKPIRTNVKANVGDYMPRGYTATLSKSLSVTSGKRSGSRDPGVVIKARAKGKSEPRYVGPLDNGELRHPVFGNRNVWRVTRIKAGFFTNEAQKGAPQARTEMIAAMNTVAEKVAHG